MSEDEQAKLANELRKELIQLKVSTLKVQAMKMGLKVPGEDISPRALRQIQDSVVELNHQQLEKEIAHWKELSRKTA